MADEKEVLDELDQEIYRILDKLAHQGKVKQDLIEKQALRAVNSYKKRKAQQEALNETMELEQNIVKKVCKELNITQRELAEMIDIPESTIARWKGGEMPRLAELYLNTLLENVDLKNKLNTIKKAYNVMAKI